MDYSPSSLLWVHSDVFPNAEDRLGHWLGVAENKGDALTYWILADNNQVLARSLICPVDEKELNARTAEPGESIDPAVTEVEGSTSSKPSLLMSPDAKNGPS